MDGKTPYEAWYGRLPNVHYLHTFGCLGYVKVVKPDQKKPDDRSTPMVLIRYEPGCKAYWMFDLVGGNLRVTRDVVFDEEAKWD